jgi:hypothetical protein
MDSLRRSLTTEIECGHINIHDSCGGDNRRFSDVVGRQLTTPRV